MNKPPSYRYQLWPQMALLFALLFPASTVGLWFLTWDLFEETDWGSFSLHWPNIVAVAGSVLPHLEFSSWTSYWSLLVDNNAQLKFAMHLCLPVVVGCAWSMWMTWLFLWMPGGREVIAHVKGGKVLQGKDAVNHAVIMNRKELGENSRAESGISIHPDIKISTAREQANFCIFGTTGAGKSMCFKPLVYQAIQRGDFAVIYDEKGEYTSAFFNQDTTHLIAPWDIRSAYWDIYRDVGTKYEADLVAQCMVPDEGEKEKMWVEGARLLFVGLMVTLINARKAWGWKELYSLISASQEDALKMLQQNYPIANTFIQKESRTTQGFYVHLIARLKWIEDMATAWPERIEDGFSIKSWVQRSDAKKIIIIQSDSRFDAIGAPLCNTLIALMTQYYLALDEGIEKRIWLFIDEFANLPKNDEIKRWLELSRSRGARSVICTQSISQLKEIYGEHDTSVLLNLLSNAISLRLGSGGEDAKYVANLLGERIVERPNKLSEGYSWNRTKEHIVESFEITQLKPANNNGVEGFMTIPGWNAVFKLVWPLYTAKSIAERHCPAEWLQSEYGEIDISPSKKPENRLNKRAK